MDESRPMTGFFASLTLEQQERALAYRGTEAHGDPAFLMERELGSAAEPLSCVGEYFPASWSCSVAPTEVETLRAALAAARAEIGGLRLRIETMEMSYRAALADRAVKPAPIHRALAARTQAFGLVNGLGF